MRSVSTAGWRWPTMPKWRVMARSAWGAPWPAPATRPRPARSTARPPSVSRTTRRVAGEAWLRGAEAWRDAGDDAAAARFVSQLRERFPDSTWAARAAEEFPPDPN